MTHLGRTVDPVSTWHCLFLSHNNSLIPLDFSSLGFQVHQTAEVIFTMIYKIWGIKKMHSDDFSQANQNKSISAGKTDYKNSFRI